MKLNVHEVMQSLIWHSATHLSTSGSIPVQRWSVFSILVPDLHVSPASYISKLKSFLLVYIKYSSSKRYIVCHNLKKEHGLWALLRGCGVCWCVLLLCRGRGVFLHWCRD